MPDDPAVVVVIVNWNGEADTIEALRSLERSECAPRAVVVVDNGSRPESLEAIRRACPSAVCLATGQNLGYAGGNNAGLRWAIEHNAEFCLVLNNDVTVDATALGRLVDVARRDPALAVVGPRVYRADARDTPFYPGWRIDWRRWLFHRVPTPEPHAGEPIVDVDWVQGCAMLVRVEFLRRHGCFDERYHLYCEDADLCVRARREGWRTVEMPQARVWHKGYGSSARRSPLRAYYGLRNRWLFVAEHAPRRSRLALWAQLVVVDGGGQALSAAKRALTGEWREGWLTVRALARAMLDVVRRRYGRGPDWLFRQ